MDRGYGAGVGKIFKIQLTIALCLSSTAALAQDWCAGRVDDRNSRIVTELAKPGYLQPFRDPAFDTQITRVTDAPVGTVRRNLYSTIQPWNIDESYLMLYHSGGDDSGHHLYDGQTYQHLRAMDFSAADIEGIYWDETDPDILYFVQRRPASSTLYGQLVRYNVSTGQRTLASDLTPVCGDARSRGWITARGGNDIQGMQGNKIGLRCQRNSQDDVSFTVNVNTGVISERVVLDPAQPQGDSPHGFRPDVAVTPLPGGNNVLVQDAVFDQNMNYLYTIDSATSTYRKDNGQVYTVPKLEHSTIGRLPNGNDALFTPQYNYPQNGCNNDSHYGAGAVVAYDLSEGTCDVAVGESTGWGYPLSGVHLSAVSSENPGWVTMTTMGYGGLAYLSNNRAAPAFFSELSLTYADPDFPRTCRLAHVRTLGQASSHSERIRGGYFGEPHAIMSPTGSRIMFNSDWHDSGAVDAYVVELGNPEIGQADSLSDTIPAPAQAASQQRLFTPGTDSATYQITADVQLDTPVPTVYLDFVNDNADPRDAIAIARTGTPDEHLLMWLFTNGTQRLDGSTSTSTSANGRLAFLQEYLGTGDFEARLFVNGDYRQVAYRLPFSINAQ